MITALVLSGYVVVAVLAFDLGCWWIWRELPKPRAPEVEDEF